MDGSIDALGGLATAGLAAKSLDGPDAMGEPEIHGAACANCGARLDGHFCSHCGQNAHVHRSLVHVGEEFLHGITHFDGKAWQTLPMLLFRPGKLTRDYIDGRRARFIAPVPLFLLVVFLMFFVFSFVHLPMGGDKIALTPAQTRAAVIESQKGIARIDKEIAEARAAVPKEPGRLAALAAARAAAVAAHDRLESRADGKTEGPIDISSEIGSEITRGIESGELKVDLGPKSLNDQIKKALKNPQLTLYKIQGKVYKFSFLLVPLSLPWLWLMFAWRRDVRMYDHAVFALYSISFMSLLFIIGCIALALDFPNGALFGFLIFVAPALHWFAQLKGTYRLGWFGAAWRTVAISFAAVITLSLYLTATLAMGLID